MHFLPTLRKQGNFSTPQVSGGLPDIEKAGSQLTPNLRALRLSLTVSDTLLSMGVPVSSVVSRALDITETYCSKPVHIDVSSNLIMVSQLRGLEQEPLTLIRPVIMNDTNNMTVQSVQELVYRIRSGKINLEKAEHELDSILKNPVIYPPWLIPIANAALAAGVDLMFTTNWHIILTTFVIVYIVDRLVFYLAKKAISTFFRQAIAGGVVTLGAAFINWLAANGVSFFDGMNPTIIVVGGIIMLLSGLAIVGAIQDAIDEYYVTANAKILKVILMTSGIVIGVLIALYIARKGGFGIAVNPNPLSITSLHFQIIGGAITAGTFAIATQTRLRAVAWAGLLGALSLTVLYTAQHHGISLVPASGLAALFVGALSKLLSRLWRTPASGIVTAGIIPLTPGLSLYTALMQLVNYPPGNDLFMRGLGTLFTAIAIAVAIAAGASFGTVLARPFNQRRTHTRNFRPWTTYMRNQLSLSQKHGIARIALMRQFNKLSAELNHHHYEDNDDLDDDPTQIHSNS